MALKQDWLYSIIALLFIKTQTRTHAPTHTRKQVNYFFKCLFEQDFRWFIANRKGKSCSNKRHQQELLNEKLNYLKTQKKATNNTQLASFKRRGHHHRWPLTRWIEFAPFNTRISQFLNPRHCFEVRHLYLPGAEHP